MLELTPILNQQDYINFVDFAKVVFIECGMFIREVIFEEERKKINPELPSRHNCLWVCEKEKVKYWHKMLGNIGSIIKVELIGKIRKCDQEYLYRELISHKQVRENARKYWNSESIGSIKDEEILFEGNVEIIKIYNSIEEFENEKKDN